MSLSPACSRLATTIALVVFMLLIVSFLASCKEQQAPNLNMAADAPKVSTRKLRVEPVSRRVEVVGRLESMTDIRVSAEAPGRVIQRVVNEGDVVDAGSLLITLDDKSLGLEVDLRRKLLDETTLQPKSAAMDRSARQLEWELAQEAFNKSKIHAPVSGTLERWLIEAGEFVVPGTPVARLLDYRHLRCFVDLAPEDALALQPGFPVEIQAEAMGEAVSRGEVRRIFRAADPESGRFRAEITLPPDGPFRLSHLHVRVTLTLDENTSGIILERSTVFRRYEENYVWLVQRHQDGPARVMEQRIKTAPMLGDPRRIRVLEGLNEGDECVLPPFLALINGAPVKPLPVERN